MRLLVLFLAGFALAGSAIAATVLFAHSFPTGAFAAAFHAGGGSVTPTFTLPSEAASLTSVTHSSTAGTCMAGAVLTSGALKTNAAGDCDCCLTHTSYPTAGIGTFTLTWSRQEAISDVLGIPGPTRAIARPGFPSAGTVPPVECVSSAT